MQTPQERRESRRETLRVYNASTKGKKARKRYRCGLQAKAAEAYEKAHQDAVDKERGYRILPGGTIQPF